MPSEALLWGRGASAGCSLKRRPGIPTTEMPKGFGILQGTFGKKIDEIYALRRESALDSIMSGSCNSIG
jgi:hypothetical protein